MTRFWFLIPCLIIILFLAACSPLEKQPVCNKPYILVGTDCCLDKNDNAICDNDEQGKIDSTMTKGKPPLKNEVQKISISDVQAGINKVLDGKVFSYTILTKQNSTQDFDFYGDSVKDLILLAKRSPDNKDSYYKSLDRFGITLFEIKSENKLIDDQQQLVLFISDNQHFLTPFADSRMIALKEQVDTGGDITIDIRSNLPHTSLRTSLNLNNFSVINSRTLHDKINPLPTVSNKIVEILQVTLESYNVSYKRSDSSELAVVDLFGIHYLQAYSVLCAPNIVITIYANPYGRPERSYRTSLTETSVKNHISQTREDMLEEAQAIVELCEQRYDFTYLRDR